MDSSYFKPPSLGIFNSNLISTCVSVGLHGVALFLLVPYITNLPSSESEENDNSPINVPLVELNPSEQSRLPEQNAGVSGIPEFPNSSLGDLPMFGSPSLQSSLPNNFSNLPSSPSLPPLPPLPSYNNNYNRIPIELPPPRRTVNPGLISRTPLPPPPSETEAQTVKPPQVIDQENRETGDPRQYISFDGPAVAPVDNPAFNQFNNQNPSVNDSPIASGPNRDINRQDEIARNLQEEFSQGVDNLIHNDQGTKREEVRDRDLEWMQQTGVTLKRGQMMILKGTYPKIACSRKLEGTAIYNVLVNDNGQLRKRPFMTQSSGYGLFNNLGLQAVKSRSFPQSTRVKVVFEYDPAICGTGVVEGETNTPPSTTPENSNNPKPESQPESEPKTPPSTTPENSNNPKPESQPESEPKTPPSTTPENSNNPKPESQPESEPKTSPSTGPENSNNPKPESQPSNSPSEGKKNPNPPPETKEEGPAAPHRGRK